MSNSIMADLNFGILLKSITAEEVCDGSAPFQKKLDKGELVVEIPKKDRISRGEGKGRGKDHAHNYHVYNEPNVTLYDDGVGTGPLEETEFQCLAAISDRTVRYQQYKTGKVEWASTLKVTDLVYFYLTSVDPTARAYPIIKGKIRYFGKAHDHNGYMFGIEILEHNSKGQGTTDGSPYFNCGHKNAVYVTMDKITKKVGSPTTSDVEGLSEKSTITTEPTSSHNKGHSKSSYDRPADNLRSRDTGKKNLIEKAKDNFSRFTGFNIATPTSIPSDVPSRFSLGDRVVLQSAAGGIVKGVVRSKGPMRMSRNAGSIVIPVVGIETTRPVNHEEEFPGLCYNVTGSHGQELFQVQRNHGRIFLSEQVVLTEDEYKDTQRKEKSEEAKEAKKWGLSVEEYKQQGKLLSERNTERDQVHDKRHLHPSPPPPPTHATSTAAHDDNEETTTAGAGVIKGNEFEETLQLGPDGVPVISEEIVKKQQEAMKQFETQKSIDDDFELVNHQQENTGQQPPPLLPASAQYPSNDTFSGNREGKITTQQRDHHDQQHTRRPNTDIEMTSTDSWQHPLQSGQSPSSLSDLNPHGSCSPHFTDDMSDALRTHARYDGHQSPSLQSHYNNPHYGGLGGHTGTGQYGGPSSTGHSPSMGTGRGSSTSNIVPADQYSGSSSGSHAHAGGSSSSGHTPPMGTGQSHQYGASSTHTSTPSGTAPMGGDEQPRHPSISSDPADFTVGTMVNVQMHRGPPRHGVIRWIGTLPNIGGMYAGVELDEYLDGCSDGSFNGMQFFSCPRGRGLFSLVSALQLDRRYINSDQVPAARKENLKNPLSHIPQYDEDDTPGGPELFSNYIGDYHGIQGHHNSCYLDATVFGLFALSDSFDELLLEDPQTDIGQTIRYILWKGIINPLRKHGVARFESIMELRNQLEALGRMKGANRDEKDPEEFLNLLFKEILHVTPFISIKRPFGVEKEFFVQLFFEIDDQQTAPPDTEKLINKMFHEQNISFTSVPSKLLLQMPRFGKEFKMFSKIIPSLEINVKSLLEGGHTVCELCKDSTATIQCSSCSDEIFKSFKYMCQTCSDILHKRRPDHKPEPAIFSSGSNDVARFSKMQLLSVICIETSHYVCFTRTNDKWLFHDSMADRLYDTFNIPKVTDVSQELNHWVYNPDNHQKLLKSPSRDVPECVRRFTQDIYMCVYTNADLDKYGGPDGSIVPPTSSS